MAASCECAWREQSGGERVGAGWGEVAMAHGTWEEGCQAHRRAPMARRSTRYTRSGIMPHPLHVRERRREPGRREKSYGRVSRAAEFRINAPKIT